MVDRHASLTGDGSELKELWNLEGSPMKEEFNVKNFDDFLGYMTLPLMTTGDPEDRAPFIGLRVCC